MPSTARLSCTIRLHQVKYSRMVGLPPVERGMLMFYNLGRIDDQSEDNSIYNQEDALKYVSFTDKYPLPLDVVLPIFSWQVHYRGAWVANLLAGERAADISDTSWFHKIKRTTFSIKRSGFHNGTYFRSGDLLRHEKLQPNELMDAAALLSKHIGHLDSKIVFYDLNETTVKEYGTAQLKEVVSCFN
jgi:hypothetical protein